MTSSGSASTHEIYAAPTCNCNKMCVIYISGTTNNPNRRFFGCPYLNEKNMPHCNYFMWEDEFIVLQARMVQLQETAIINHYEREMEVMKIQMDRVAEAKTNQLEMNIIERDIEVVRFQMYESQVTRSNRKPCCTCTVSGLLIVAFVISFWTWWKYKLQSK
ncbi:uncharacterized protein LOC123890105 [Trifolium pratense]|uniref:uncharacterized protein LOC123890105 n=1 Tax=Trifolium pratense TaxID=57577 RepID=UPI001E695A0B|nr:uncharacterized protein LOC123890105 [Trifolium pratense]